MNNGGYAASSNGWGVDTRSQHLQKQTCQAHCPVGHRKSASPVGLHTGRKASSVLILTHIHSDPVGQGNSAWHQGLRLLVSSSCCCLVTKSCPTLGDSLDHSPPDSYAYGISQAGILDGLPFPSPGDLPDPGFKPKSPALAGGFFTTESPGKPPNILP